MCNSGVQPIKQGENMSEKIILEIRSKLVSGLKGRCAELVRLSKEIKMAILSADGPEYDELIQLLLLMNQEATAINNTIRSYLPQGIPKNGLSA